MALLTDGQREMRMSKVAFRTLASVTPVFELLSEDWEGSRSRHSRTTGPAVRGAAAKTDRAAALDGRLPVEVADLFQAACSEPWRAWRRVRV